MRSKWIGIAVVVASAIGLSGCASNEQLKADIQKAMSMARSAQQAAQSAQQAAQQAQQTAEHALSVAQEAKQCCKANSQRIERMFETSMRK